MFIAVLFIVAPKQQTTQIMSANYTRINTLWYIHPMGCYPAMRGNKLLLPASVCLNLMKITCSE